jgi:hypothetical protein
MWMPTWENMSVTITQTSGDGGKINFDDARIQPPRFTFRGVYMPVPNACPELSHYRVDFDAGYMVDWWSSVSLFPLGNTPLPAISPLPPYENTPKIRALYHEALFSIRRQLSSGNGSYQRLEGLMGVIYGGEPVVDRVTVVYQDDAVHNSDGTTSPLVVFTFQYADGVFHPLENGGASGPPH